MNARSSCWLYPLAVAFASFLCACGGGGIASPGTIGGNKPQTGPNGILNGASLSVATTHWVSAACHVQVELTTDKNAYTVVIDKSGTTSAGTGTWAISTDPASVGINSAGAGTGGFCWVSSLQGITGSVASNSFAARVSVSTGGTSQTLGTCSFVLTQGNLIK